MSFSAVWLEVILGAILLLSGRRLFWLSLGLLGFVFTFFVVSRLPLDLDPQWIWVLAVLMGLVGAFLAVVLQKVALGAAGFLSGGFAVLYLVDEYGLALGNLEWFAAILGGLLLAILTIRLFSIGLIVLTSVLGAGLVVDASALPATPRTVAFFLLVLIGIAVQTRWRGREREKKKSG